MLNWMYNSLSSTDAYAQNRSLENLCADAGQADKHCTVGVSNLDAGDAARRIDYIFVNKIKDVSESRVGFNTLIDPNQLTVAYHPAKYKGRKPRLCKNIAPMRITVL